MRQLERDLYANAEAEVKLALSVGVLSAMGYTRAQTASILAVSPADVRGGMERLRRVASGMA